MAIYATAAELADYVEDNEAVTAPEADAAEPLLTRAERDVDLLLGPGYTRVPETGLKLDPETLTAAQRAALSRATCAAAEFRLTMGEDLLVGASEGIAAIGSLSFSRDPIPRSSPKAVEELSGHGLLKRHGTVAPSPDADAA